MKYIFCSVKYDYMILFSLTGW